MKIEKIKIKNYKVLKDISLTDLPSMCVFLGANGAGKSTLFDVFGFLGDALKNNVKTAVNRRGGFKELISRNATSGLISLSLSSFWPSSIVRPSPTSSMLSQCLAKRVFKLFKPFNSSSTITAFSTSIGFTF